MSQKADHLVVVSSTTQLARHKHSIEAFTPFIPPSLSDRLLIDIYRIHRLSDCSNTNKRLHSLHPGFHRVPQPCLPYPLTARAR